MRGSEHKQFWCTHPGCDKVFNRRDYLERHATNHLKVKPYMCVQCNRHFSRKDLYDNHLTTKRHARVTHEVEQANYENQIGQLGDSMANNDSVSNNLDLNDVPQLQHVGMNPDNVGRNKHSRYNPGALSYSTDPNNLELSPMVSRGRLDEYDDSHLPMYAPPLQQPLYLSGPGPGSVSSSGLFDNVNRKSLYFDNNHRYPAYESLTMNLNEGPDIQLSNGTPADIDIPWANQYLGVSPTGKLSTLGSQGHSPLGSSSTLGGRMNSITGMNTGFDGISASQSRANMMSVDGMQDPGRFSSYGVTLGLTSSNTEPSTKSDGSTSDDYTSDADGTSAAAIVGDRLRKDMADNPYPPLKNLRDSIVPTVEAPSLDTAGVSLAIVDTAEQLQQDSLALKDGHACDGTAFESSKTPQDSARNPLEVVAAVTGDSRYSWFFDDVFDTAKAKLGYDRCFADAVEAYQIRANDYNKGMRLTVEYRHDRHRNSNTSERRSSANHQSGASPSNLSDSPEMIPDVTSPPEFGRLGLYPNKEFFRKYPAAMKSLSHDRAEVVLSILRDVPLKLTSLDAVSEWIQTALIQAEPIAHIVHPATFDPNNSHNSLLVVLALIGMSLSQDRAVANAAKRAFAPGFLYAYEALVQVPNNLTPSKLDASMVNILQAFSLLLRYERLVLLGDGSQVSFTKNSPGHWATNLFFEKVLSAVPHVGEFSTPMKHQPIWATISAEGYLFHEGADLDLQWREWSLLEAVKRVAHFSLYCDSMASLASPKPHPISIFNMDIHMICPEPTWQARNPKEFFHIFGKSGMISNVPYLGLIKSLIRFPRMAPKDDFISSDRSKIKAPWSIFALKVVAHGLIMIVGRLSGLIPHNDEMLEFLLQDRADPCSKCDIFSKFDRKLQARLYRGLDMWYQLFGAVYGDVTEKILHVSGSMSLPIREEFDPTQNDDDRAGVPQYALIIILCHYSSFIFVHEDLPVVLQITANLKMWLEANQSTSLQMLLDYLYMPLYTNWIKTEEAKGMVSACSLYLAWHQAIAGNVITSNHMFLSAMIYISVAVVWLYDCASHVGSYELAPLHLKDFKFMDDAVDYLHGLYMNVSGQTTEVPKRSINSLLLMASCLLYKRKSTKPLVNMLVQLLSVMDSTYSKEELITVVKQSAKVYDERVSNAKEAITCSQGTLDGERGSELRASLPLSGADDMDADPGPFLEEDLVKNPRDEIIENKLNDPTIFPPDQLSIDSPVGSMALELDAEMGNISDLDTEIQREDPISTQTAVDDAISASGA